MSRLICRVALLAAVLSLHAPSFARSAPAAGITAEIKSAASGKFKKFYKARGYLPLWARRGTISPDADRLIALLSSAELDGLDAEDYRPDVLRQAVAEARGGARGALGRTEMKLSKALFAYVRDLRDPRSLPTDGVTYADARLKPQRVLPADVLLQAAIAPSLGNYIDGLGWMSPFYGRLRSALVNFRERWNALPAVGVPDGAVLRTGAKGDRVAALRRRLGFPDGSRFDKALAWKLKVFQAEHGLAATGVADARTLSAINQPSAVYEQRIRLNLARARLLPPAYVRHVVVDAGSATLWMIDARAMDSMRVVVGEAKEQTPLMVGSLRYAILNPYWNIPVDLVRDRVAPKVLGGQSFTAMRYEALSDWTVNARPLDPNAINWKAVAAGQQELRVRMLPGGQNWMGRVKFMFPNQLGIYLHDFPDKALFSEPARHFSSGCVRLDDAPRLGRWLAGEPLQSSGNAPEQYRTLPQPVPIYITYLTVMPTENGIAFLDDAYGLDSAVQGQQLARIQQ